MLNEEFIIDLIKPHLNNKKEISSADCMLIFNGFSFDELMEIKNIIQKNGINYLEESSSNFECILDENSELKSEPVKNFKNFISSAKYKNLSNEILCDMYRKGDQSAIESLLIKNEKLIWNIVLKVSKVYKHPALDLDDLFQAGAMGATKAAEKFDISLDYKYTTYATWWIKQVITRTIADEAHMIRLPVHMVDKVYRFYRYRSYNQTMSDEEIIQYIIDEELKKGYATNKSDVIYTLNIAEQLLNTTSLNVKIGEQEDSELMDFLPSQTINNPEEEAISNDLKSSINFVLSFLKEREKRVIIERFGLETGCPKTLEEIGSQFGVTRERIRQIEAKALKKLKQHSRKKYLINYLKEE